MIESPCQNQANPSAPANCPPRPLALGRWLASSGYWLGLSLLGMSLLATGCKQTEAPKTAAEPPKQQRPLPEEGPDAQLHTNIALPVPDNFYGLRLASGTSLLADEFLVEISDSDVVCVGESHAAPHHHWAQYRVLSELIERQTMSGRKLALGLEMVSKRNQGDLNRWARRELRTKNFLEEINWNESWGYDFGYYAPALRLARSRRVELLGLNLPRETTKAIAESGLRNLDQKAGADLPARMDFFDEEHHAYFTAAMGGHPPPKSKQKYYYEAQVAWDETMADTAARWLSKGQPASQLLIFAGAGHCHHSAIPKRVAQRVPDAKVVSILPWREGESPSLDEIQQAKLYDYALVMSEAISQYR